VSDAKPTALPVGSARLRSQLFRHPWRVATVSVALLLVLNLVVVLLNNADTSREQTTGLPATITSLQPRPGELIRPQDTITVQLRPELTGTLVLDGQEIPEGQLSRVAGLGEVSFRPGPGKDLSELPPGTHTVTIEYWVATKPRPTHPATFSWSFRVGA
jgi:hypothetical protein